MHAQAARGRSLRSSVGLWCGWAAVGTVAVSAALAWLFSAAQRDGSPAWARGVSAEQWLMAVVSASLLVATVIGAAGAALAHRRQRLREADQFARDIAHRQNDISARRLKLEIDRYRLDRSRHDFALARRHDARVQMLRGRFGESVRQLAAPRTAARLAGAYALAELADEWHRLGVDGERQVCVSLLCGQLRVAPRTDDDDREFRRTVLGLLRGRRRNYLPIDGETSWRTCEIDLSGASLAGADLSDTDLRHTDLGGVDLSGANLTSAELSGAVLVGATLYQCWLMGADLRDAVLVGADLRRASLVESDIRGADFTGADLDSARLDRARSDSGTTWPVGR